MAAKKSRSIRELTEQANKYAMEYLQNRPLGLPELSEEDFPKVMDAVVRAMVNAWADGYTAAGK